LSKPPEVIGKSGKAFGLGIRGDESFIGCGNTRYHERFVNVDSTADRIYDFRHNHLLKHLFETTGRDWTLTLKIE
jgi:hypothetical protein